MSQNDDSTRATKPLSASEVIRIQKRVLRFVDSFLALQPQEALTANRRGSLATWAEIRQHVRGAAALKVKR